MILIGRETLGRSVLFIVFLAVFHNSCFER